jgi:hypothetical protein
MGDYQPCWINWIQNTPAKMLGQFNVIIHRWLREPSDWSEEKWFDPAWKERLYGIESATEFFKKIPRELHWFFRIEITEGVLPDSEKEFDCAF